jgi:hypothetical protein
MPDIDSKTRDEWQYLHSFQHLCRDFPSGEIRKHEGPDFLITTGAGHTIGIEIGRVYKDYSKTSEQSVEATKEAITVAARAYCEDVLKSPPAFVSLYFTLSRHMKPKACQEIAQRVARAVHENIPPVGESVKLEYRSGGLQPIEVDLIIIGRDYPRATSKWIWPEYASIQTDAISKLEHRIDEKNKKLPSYLWHCDDCWLLIVAQSFKSSGNIHPDEHSISYTYASSFSRTYFLDYGLGDLFLLRDKNHDELQGSQ